MTVDSKRHQKNFDAYIDNIDDEQLTLLQKDLLKYINYFILEYGTFIFISDRLSNRYAEIATNKQIGAEIQNMIDRKIVFVKDRKTIYNGKFVTKKTFTINEMITNMKWPNE